MLSAWMQMHIALARWLCLAKAYHSAGRWPCRTVSAYIKQLVL